MPVTTETITFDEAVSRCARALSTAESEADPMRADAHIRAAGVWLSLATMLGEYA